MLKHTVMLDHHHHAANLNDSMMLSGLLIQKVGLFACSLNIAPEHKSPHDKPDSQRNNNPECNARYRNNPADDVWFHGFPSFGAAGSGVQ
jgi:hypothetical protein